MMYFRGTVTKEQEKTALGGAPSWTPCLGAAIVWAAVPPNVWSSSKEAQSARFAEGSTVTAAKISAAKVLDLGGPDQSLGEVLRALSFEKDDGITTDEAMRIFNYMHNRLIGKARGGEFKYRVFDADGEAMDPQEVPLSFSMPETLISMTRDDFDLARPDTLPTTPAQAKRARVAARLAEADRVSADAFIFADTPTVQKVARRLGFDAIVYLDAFGGGPGALRDLMGIDPEQVDCLTEEDDPFSDDDWRQNTLWLHETLRPLSDDIVKVEWSESAPKVAADYVKLVEEAEDE